MSSLHILAMDFTDGESLNIAMRGRNDIAARLRLTQAALGLRPVDLCSLIGCAENKWSQYTSEKGKRRITEKVANALCDEFSVTLDWIYRGNPAGLPLELRMKLAKLAA